MTFGGRCDDFVYRDENRDTSQHSRSKRPAAKRDKRAGDPFDRIVRLCAVRDRSRCELDKRLVDDGYDEQTVRDALDRAEQCGLVDDKRFADVLVRSRVSAGKGEKAILRDLEKHDIDPDILSDWPDGYGLDETSQVERAVSILQRRPPTAKDAWSAAFRKLMGKGYSQAVSTKAARQWFESTAK